MYETYVYGACSDWTVLSKIWGPVLLNLAILVLTNSVRRGRLINKDYLEN